MMYRIPLVPDDFIVPTELVTDKFVLRPLTINYVDKDFEAVQNSADENGKPTPRPQLTKEQNLIDLAWHQKEFQKRSSFAYTVLTPDEKECLGCVYIYPSENVEIEAVVDYWVIKNIDKDDFFFDMGKIIQQWLMEYWPFRVIEFIPLQELLRCKSNDGECWERDVYAEQGQKILTRDAIYPEPVIVKRMIPLTSTQR